MKTKIFFCVLLLTFCFGMSQAQWVSNYTTSSMKTLSVLNADTVFAGGHNLILRTINSGITWQNVFQEECDIYDIDFHEPVIGYAAGIHEIFKTTDGGHTWFSIKENADAWFVRLAFTSPEVGLAIAQFNLIDTLYRTNDGGITWYPVISGIGLENLQMIDEQVGFLIADSLYKTADGGQTWQAVFGGDNLFESLIFTNADTGLVLGSQLFKTLDGGSSFEIIPNSGYTFPIVTSEPQSQFSASGGSFYFCFYDALADEGGVLFSSDGGYNWIKQIDGKFSDIEMATDSIGYAVTIDGGIYKTDNGGFPVGEDELNESYLTHGVRVFPIPMTDYLFVVPEMKCIFILFDSEGKQVFSQEVCSRCVTRIPCTSLKKGIYYYEILNENEKIESGKLIKK